MRLAAPWFLCLFLLVIYHIHRHYRKKGEQALTFPTLRAFKQTETTLRQRFIPALFWLQMAATSLLIVALARPQNEELTQGIPKEGIAIELCVDISSSMDISMPFQDASMSRMEVTKQVLQQFVGGGDQLAGRPNDLIGLISFARFADTLSPLTDSHDALLYQINELAIEDRPNEDGTAFGDALTLAAARLKTAEERYTTEGKSTPDYTIKSKVIILLTDGNNNCGTHLPMEAAALAKHWGIRIHTIAITDPPEMKTIETPEGPVKVEAEPLVQERILQKMAETTGGIYRRAIDEDSLRDIYAEINTMETSEIKTVRYRTYTEYFQPFALTGLLLLLLHAGLTTTWLRRIP